MAAEAGPRERLLSALDALSEQYNVLDIGINQLLAQADVAKASLYSHFGSKEALIAAWLDKRQSEWFGWFEQHLAQVLLACDPQQELDAAFGFLESWLARDDFAGCPFVTIYLQLRDREHPAGQRATAYATRLRGFFEERLRALGLPQSSALATALLELFLGAIVVQQLGVGSRAAHSARHHARLLVETALAQPG